MGHWGQCLRPAGLLVLPLLLLLLLLHLLLLHKWDCSAGQQRRAPDRGKMIPEGQQPSYVESAGAGYPLWKTA